MSGILPTHIHDLAPSSSLQGITGHYAIDNEREMTIAESAAPTTENRPEKRRAVTGPSRIRLDEMREDVRMHQSRALMLSVERRQECARAQEMSQEVTQARESIQQLQEQADVMRAQYEKQVNEAQQRMTREYDKRVAELQQIFALRVEEEAQQMVQQRVQAAPQAIPQQQTVTDIPIIMQQDNDDDDVEAQMVEHILQNERTIVELEAENARLVQQRDVMMREHERDMSDKVNEIMAMRRRFNTDVPPRVPTSRGLIETTQSFPNVPPQTIAEFVTPTQRRVRAIKGKERALRGQPADMPIVPLRPSHQSAMPNSATGDDAVSAMADSATNGDGANATTGSSSTAEIPNSILTFDPENPVSVKAVASIVEAVLKEIGIEKATLSGRRRTKNSSSGKSRSTTARAQAIREQQALIDPQQDCAWKRAIREVWRFLYKTAVSNDFASYKPAETTEVEACNAGTGDGPGQDLRLDFSRGYLSSRWNRIILDRIFVTIQTARENQDGWGLPDVSKDYIMGELYGQLKRSQEAWSLVQPRFLLASNQFERPEQVAARVEQYCDKRLSASTSRTTRKRKLEKRMKIVETVIAVKAHERAVDLPTWQYFKKLLELLSVGGMSSEECGTEAIGTRTMSVFRVKLCLWRAKEISDYLRIIDRAGELPVIHGKAGPKSAPRLRTEQPGRTPAPGGLPRKMYHPEWLREQERKKPLYVEDELRISEEAFELLVLATVDI